MNAQKLVTSKKSIFISFLLMIFLNPVILAQEITPDIYKSLAYRYIGPPGNRTSAVIGVPGDPMVYYIGASSGGIFKSEDGGLNWFPVFDDHQVQSIGALAIAPSAHNIVWAGTGEAFIRSNVSIGNGVYKSVDAGKSWKHMGLDKTGRIGRIVIHPQNPDIVYAGALGHCYGPQQERGVYKSTDGGKTWKRVLFADENTGCFEIVMDPSNPDLLFAGMWPVTIKTYTRESGGPKGGIYRSTDGGETWKHLQGKGLPELPVGKVGLAIAYSNPSIVYALIETGAPNRGVLWKSEDSGDNWKCVSYDRIINERPHYASRIMVNPSDENLVYFAANSHSISYDGGITTEVTGWSGDTHDMWADPLIPDRLMISDDGGAIISANRGKSWNRITLPIAQMYHVSVDNQVPYYVYGGKQDGPGYKGPAYARPGVRGWGIPTTVWETTAGGECGFIKPDPVNPDIVWGGLYNAGFTRLDYSTGHERTVQVWPESAYGSAAGELKYRFNWTFPIEISPHDHNKIFVGSQYVHVTTDGGASWEVISPDLSTNDISRMQASGGLTKDNIGVEYACIVFALAESPIEEGLIWAGTNDGLVHVTKNGGDSWTNLSGNIPGLPPWGTISNLEPSRYDPGTCYMTVDFHQMNIRDPFVYKTTDYGKSWKSISSTIPKSVFSYCHWIHEDPVRKGLLYLGTENSIYVSFNDGKKWLPLQNNLPHAPVHDIVVQEHFNDLVVATYGRGFWIMDDITPLQQLNDKVLRSEVYLFKPRIAYRMHSIKGGPPVRSTASINYYLKNAQDDEIKITILDEDNNIVRVLRGKGNKGINSLTWDLRQEPIMQARLRTKPQGNPRVVEEKRFRTTWEREGWYPLLSWGTSAGFAGITVVPGEYSVKLEAGDEVMTQILTVMKDPGSAGTIANIKDQFDLQNKVQDDLESVTAMINTLEWLKKQIIDMEELVNDKEVIQQAKLLYMKLQKMEDKLVQPTIAEGDSKSFRFAQKLYFKYAILAGDIAQSVDFAPSRQQHEVYNKLHAGLEAATDEFNTLIPGDVRQFNMLVKQQGITGGIIVKFE